MSLFEKPELLNLLNNTYNKAIDEGKTEYSALKLSRLQYRSWVSDFTAGLKQQIKVSNKLDSSKKEERRDRQAVDFHYFRKTYFSHYYSLEGKSKLQEHLEESYYRIIDRLKPYGLRFAIAAPRGFGKSTDASIVFPIWCIVNGYKNFITIFSDAIELAETLVESIKAELEENERLKADFPEATGVGLVWKIGNIVTKNNIKVRAYGSGKRVRGVKHGVFRPDLAIIDELENDTNVRSRIQRNKREEWLDEAIENLGSVDDSMDILYIGTILHRDSVLSRKLKLKFWNPIKFRALITYPTNMDFWDEYTRMYKEEGAEEAHNYYLENKKLMDAGAQLLWESVDLENLMRKRAKNSRAFQKEQQNNPNSESQKFDSAKFQKISYTQMPKLNRVYGFVDVKGDSDVGDYFAVVIGGVSDITQKLYVFYSMHKRVKGRAAILEMLKITKQIKMNLLGGDKNGGFHYYRDWFKSEAWQQGIKIPYLKFTHHTDNKEDRMGELEFAIYDDIIFVGDHHELFNEMDDFPESDFDDLHDALTGVFDLSKVKNFKRKGSKRTNVRGDGNRHQRKSSHNRRTQKRGR